jgi:hypothetical protein
LSFKLAFNFRNRKSCQERDQGCRVAVKSLLFFVRNFWKETPRAWECCCSEEISCIPSKVPVVSFTMLLVHSVKQSVWIINLLSWVLRIKRA